MKEQRASKKQRELLSFIDSFIKGNGYGPSYREIMRALDYKSVSTVAVHVDGLITRGFLAKSDHSARSLEVISTDVSIVAPASARHLDWLRREIRKRQAKSDKVSATEATALHVALNILDQPEV